MRWLAALLAALIVLSPTDGLAQRRHRKSSKPKKNVGQLRKDLSRLREKKAQLRAELKTTKRAASAVLADIHQVDAQLGDLEGKLEQTGERLDESRTEQKQVATELELATKRLAVKKEQVRKRIRRMYMQGDATFLTVLAGAGDVGEIASRKSMLERIAGQDKRVFTEYQQLQAQVSRQKRQADALVMRVGSLLQEQKEQQSSLKDARVKKGKYLGELQAKQGELQEMLAQFAADEQTIAAQIRAYSRRPRTRNRKGQFTGPLPTFRGGRFSYPVSGRITSNFGMRYHPILHITRMHAGCDFGAPIGARISAASDGVVIHSSYMSGYGNVVIIDHGGGISTVYAHCSRINVSDGQSVKRGEHIANVGSTGLSTGPHLHFEVRVNGRAVNPRGYL